MSEFHMGVLVGASLGVVASLMAVMFFVLIQDENKLFKKTKGAK